MRLSDSPKPIPHLSDLSPEEVAALKLVVVRSFISKNAIPLAQRQRLTELGLIQLGLGGIMPTPMGRMVVRR